LVINFFRKCGISLFLCVVIPILLIMSGCIEKPMQLAASSSQVPEGQVAEDRTAEGVAVAEVAQELDDGSVAVLPSHLQVDFDSEVCSNLFRVKGNLAFAGSSSLPYLLLNATLLQEGRATASTKYLLIKVEPGEDHGFEISKNIRIPEGSYDCRLEATGPQGLLSSETRGCHLAAVWEERASLLTSISPDELEKKTAKQKSQEEKLLREKIENKRDQEESTPEEAAKDTKSSGSDDKKLVDEPKPEASATKSPDALKNIETNDKAAAREGLQDSRGGPSSENDSPSSQTSRSIDASASRSAEMEAQLAGSTTSKKYHRPDCRYALKIKTENKIFFASVEDAQKQGYLPCKTCSP
jgi:hypothetical protein